LMEAAAFLKEQGAVRVTAAFTHAVLSGNAVERLDASVIESFVFTDTVPLQGKSSPKFEVISVAEIFAKAIRRIHKGDSLSELFR